MGRDVATAHEAGGFLQIGEPAVGAGSDEGDVDARTLHLSAALEPHEAQRFLVGRIAYALANLMNAPEASAIGIGDLDDARLTASIAVIAEAYELKNKPAAGDVFNRSFLPPKADRQISIKTN